MDSYEAARAVFSRIQSVDPNNASKIIAYILLQDQAEKEMIRLAFGPENLIHSVVNIAKSELGISSNTSSAPNPSPPISISRPNPLSLSSPSSPSMWAVDNNNNHHSLSYAAVVNGTPPLNSSFSPLSSPHLPLNRDNFMEDQSLSFLNDPLSFPSDAGDFLDQPPPEMARSPSCRSDSLVYPFWENGGSFENDGGLHRRASSVNDICYGTDDSTSGFGFKPCLYFAKGFCKNGGTCKFIHGGGGFSDAGDGANSIVGSPCKLEAFEQCQQELIRSKLAQQQRLAMAGVNFPYNKLNFLQTETQRSAAATLMMGEEFHKMNRCRFGRNDFTGDSNPGARQIYLTFPADSTFKEEDVSNYFSLFGPVQDVRIPYQQKRMFGFVTFVYPETVRIILAKGNPHFVCDSRVLVKPYKEKGKLPDKKQSQQQFERSDYSSCGSPSGLDCREPFEMHVGPRMFYNNQEMMLRKKLEQEADWQQALELQSRRLMNLQLLDMKNHQRFAPNMPVGYPPCSLNQSQAPLNPNFLPPNGINHGTFEDGNIVTVDEVNANSDCSNGINKEDSAEMKASESSECLEHILPDSLFASPTKLTAEERSVFKAKPFDNGANDDPLTSPTSTLDKPSLKSCFLEIPRKQDGDSSCLKT